MQMIRFITQDSEAGGSGGQRARQRLGSRVCSSPMTEHRPKQVHPFPARMAPELALEALERAPDDAVVLDPMCGSGTVLQHARERGMSAFGYDIDPDRKSVVYGKSADLG